MAREQISTMNWLINQAMVVCDAQGYALFSPVFTEFLANRLAETPIPAAAPVPPSIAPPVPPLPPDAPIFEQLTKTESALLRYFQNHAHTIISPEELLAEVWKRPDASPRRVQEAIRRLRLELEEAVPPVGTIENERGQGYRFVPADR